MAQISGSEILDKLTDVVLHDSVLISLGTLGIGMRSHSNRLTRHVGYTSLQEIYSITPADKKALFYAAAAELLAMGAFSLLHTLSDSKSLEARGIPVKLELLVSDPNDNRTRYHAQTLDLAVLMNGLKELVRSDVGQKLIEDKISSLFEGDHIVVTPEGMRVESSTTTE